MVATRLFEELVNLVDIVGLLRRRSMILKLATLCLIIVDPASDKYVAKTAPVG